MADRIPCSLLDSNAGSDNYCSGFFLTGEMVVRSSQLVVSTLWNEWNSPTLLAN